MKITVEMTEELFEEFLQFRKAKDIYETGAKREINSLRGRITYLSNVILAFANGKSAKAKTAAKEEALELASDWLNWEEGRNKYK